MEPEPTSTMTDTGGLREAIRGLESADTLAASRSRADELVEACRSHSLRPPDEIDLSALTRAAEVLLTTFKRTSGDSDRGEALRQSAHAFIDLARAKGIRRAAYPADNDAPGGLWLDRIIWLIEQTDFTVGRMFRQRAAQAGEKTLFVVPHGEAVTEYSWEEVADVTRRIARGILALDGDDARVALYTPNRIEGALVDLACLTNGIFNTMVAANAVESQLDHILVESRARTLVVSGSEPLQRAFAALERIPTLDHVITLDSLPTVPGARVMTLDRLIDLGGSISDTVLETRVAAVRSGDIATTMYTSGTTGAPKGITFSHLNLVSKRFARPAALPDIDDQEVLVCYLPLYHTFGRYLEMLACVHLAATYVLAENASTETLIGHMRRFRPTALISVPKKWLDIYDRAGAGEEPPDDPNETDRALRRLVGDRLRWGLSAAGRLDPAVFRFYHRHGVELLSGYGMTEATGGITMTPPGQYVDDSIGKALPAIELDLDEDNQLRLRGPYVTGGYTSPEETAAAFRDGWFETGDIVERDATGFLRHVDRKKDIYKNTGGRTIAPQRVEGLFHDLPEISRVFAVGDGRDYVTLLIRPNPDYRDVAYNRMTDAEKYEYFRGLVVSCNRFLAPFERVVKFALIDRDFSMDHGELTPKGSFRRAAVDANFRDVIEPMYASSTIERVVDGLHVKIPIAFLQHLGATEAGAQVEEGGIAFRAIGKLLRIRTDGETPGNVWIGNCCYTGIKRDIDLDEWLRHPKLWIGNADLTSVTGEAILLWSLWDDDRNWPVRMSRVGPSGMPLAEWQERLAAPPEAAPSLLTVHAAALALHGGSTVRALDAAEYLTRTLTAGRVRYQELAESHLQHAAEHRERAVRSRAFLALYEHQRRDAFQGTAQRFCGSGLKFLDPESCDRIAAIGFRPEHWAALTQALAVSRRGLAASSGTDAVASTTHLLEALGRIAEQSDDYFLPVRRELTLWTLAPVPEPVRDAAERTLAGLRARLRKRLGTRHDHADDPDTGQAYTWADTLRFEDGIDPNQREHMTAALTNTELIREAVYLLHRQRQIDLGDLTPGGIWISLIGTRFGRSAYHAAVRLRSLERADFTLLVRGTAPESQFDLDLRLLCAGSGDPGETELTPEVGGVWPEHGIAACARVSGESVEARIRAMYNHPDRNVLHQLKQIWRNVSWSALTAAFEFYRRTEGRWVLTGTLTRDVTVPIQDFNPNTRVFPVAGWRPFENALALFLTLKHAFLDRVRFHFPALTPQTPDDFLPAGAIEALGLQAGLSLIKDAIAEGRAHPNPTGDLKELCQTMQAYVERLEQSGYVPRALHFAIERYRSWAAEVPNADLHARAAQLRELQSSYGIEAATRKFPGSRLRLYLETVLCDAPAEGRKLVEKAIDRLREGAPITQVLGRLYTNLREKLPSHDHQYFLARAAYPHLDVQEKAALVTSSEVGRDHAELVTMHTDRTSREIRIRPAANSRELDTLHRIFYTGGIGGGLTAHERFLVALDDADHVIGGVGYIHRTPRHVLLDKISVLPRCRGRGIGKLLLHDFLRRQQAEHVGIVSAQFIRASWLGQFGFRSHPRYPGVVLPLTDRSA
jgi:long-subunit acyl-CoA synthetase (AMP-forming)/GNAT superfamily N-acetyltransferase